MSVCAHVQMYLYVSVYIKVSLSIAVIFNCIQKLPDWIYGIQKTCHRTSPTGHMDKNKPLQLQAFTCDDMRTVMAVFLSIYFHSISLYSTIYTMYIIHPFVLFSSFFPNVKKRCTQALSTAHHYYCYANISKCEWVASSHFNGMNSKIAF